jgi:glycosyltransferase involved in cell wall biosynthesis
VGHLVSVVVPVRNGMPFIKEAISSVLDDPDARVEVIVAENFSTDGTAEWLAEQTDPRLRVVAAAEPLSAGANWTRACELADGDWVKILCADDFLPAGGLDRQLAAAAASPSATLIASRRRVVGDDGDVVLARHGLSGFRGRFGGPATARRAILSGSNPFGEPSSVLFRRDALQASLPFTEVHPYLTDLDMYVRVLEKGDFVGLPTVDGAFRLNTTSWSAAIGNRQLEEHRTWIESLENDGTIRIGRGARILLALRLRARFLARRAVTSLSALRARRS